MIQLKFSNQIPEIYTVLHEKFGVEWDKGIVITYGNTVHSKQLISADLVVHEATHMQQQTSMGIEEWWKKYLDDPNFRFSQEIEAYKNQAKYIREHEKNRNRRFLMIDFIRRSLCGPTYGNICTYKQAKELLPL